MNEKFRLVDYDVWGNADEGWEVNQEFGVADITVSYDSDEPTEDEIFAALFDKGYLNPENRDEYELDWGYDRVDILIAESQRPVCAVKFSDTGERPPDHLPVCAVKYRKNY
jgi:hypothetical protein